MTERSTVGASAVQADSQNQAALRDRIAEALYTHDHPGHLVPLNKTGMGAAYRDTADAVLAVLPEPVGRVAAWRAAADELDSISDQFDGGGCLCGDCALCTWTEAARHLRREAVEFQKADAADTGRPA
ncbi:hypothetical protein [Streptomyces sp. AcH 505]|uniref:hypothetical protein n=1 Tax=Streptomyces sp. AcH 505 TaxID=352211 RepID=UPI0012FEE37B